MKINTFLLTTLEYVMRGMVGQMKAALVSSSSCLCLMVETGNNNEARFQRINSFVITEAIRIFSIASIIFHE